MPPKTPWIDNSRYYLGKGTTPIQTTRRPMRWSRRKPTAIGRLSTIFRSTFDILSLKVYLSKEVFLCFVGILTYDKSSLIFPLLLIKIRA